MPRNAGFGLLALLVVLLGIGWAVLVNHLRPVWSSNPEYRYGWAVPILCAVLMLRKVPVSPAAPRSPGLSRAWIVGGVIFLSLLFAPTRLIEAANSDWRVISWALALEMVGLTLGLIFLALGPLWWRRLAFPIAFFLVAVPWPTVLENVVIQDLTRADTRAAVEVLDWLGIAALPHGNIIEVATGEVGVDEACSGIRSLQATLMISLFLGELYQLSWGRRLGLFLGGFALSFLFNLIRLCVLTWVAAGQGIAAVTHWHDSTGETILVACCVTLWALSRLLSRRKNRPPVSPAAPTPNAAFAPRRVPVAPAAPPAVPHIIPLLLSLLAWFALVQISVESWYRWHENRLPPVKTWTVSWPTGNPTFQTVPLSAAALTMLQFDLGQSREWQADGIQWQAVFLQWNPERRARVLAQLHTPDVCLTAGGHPTTRESTLAYINSGGRELPFSVYSVANTPQPMHVFYCLWNDRATAGERQRMPRKFADRWEPVRAGVRACGHHSLEIALTGNLTEPAAEAALQQELAKILRCL